MGFLYGVLQGLIGSDSGYEFNAIDAGISGMIGYRYKSVFIETGYRHGLTESGRYWGRGKNRVINFGIGVNLFK